MGRNNLRVGRANLADPVVRETVVDFNMALAWEIDRKVLDRDLLMRGIEAQWKNPGFGHYYLAYDDDDIVGMCRIWVEYFDWEDALIWWFDNVYCVRRRQGIFRALFQHVLASAKAAGVLKFRLHVHKNNPIARDVYECLGFDAPSDMMEFDISGRLHDVAERSRQELQVQLEAIPL